MATRPFEIDVTIAAVEHSVVGDVTGAAVVAVGTHIKGYPFEDNYNATSTQCQIVLVVRLHSMSIVCNTIKTYTIRQFNFESSLSYELYFCQHSGCYGVCPKT